MRGCTLKAWDVVCRPRSYDGVGFHRFCDFNDALIAKLCWEFETRKDKLWVKVLSSRYGSLGAFSEVLAYELSFVGLKKHYFVRSHY